MQYVLCTVPTYNCARELIQNSGRAKVLRKCLCPTRSACAPQANQVDTERKVHHSRMFMLNKMVQLHIQLTMAALYEAREKRVLSETVEQKRDNQRMSKARVRFCL